jgi:hypothetical protein
MPKTEHSQHERGPRVVAPSLVPVSRDITPQTRTPAAPEPQEPAGTAHISLGARPPSCERDTRRADHRCQAANEPAGSAGTTPRGTGTTAAVAPSQR